MPGVMRVGHADEPAAGQRCLPTGPVTKAKGPPDRGAADVELVTVAEQFDVGEPDRVLTFDAQLQDEPVRQVDEVFVEDGQAAKDRGLAVVAAVRVRSRVVDAVGVFPLRRAAGTQVAVARGGQRLPQPLGRRVETVVSEQETVHGTSSVHGPSHAPRREGRGP